MAIYCGEPARGVTPVTYYGPRSLLVTGLLLTYAWVAHSAQLLEPRSITGEQRKPIAQEISASCEKNQIARGAGENLSPAKITSYCSCYAENLLDKVSMSELASIENGVTYRFQIKADRASDICRAQTSTTAVQ